MPYILGLIGGISLGLLLASLIAIKMCDSSKSNITRELIFVRDTIDDATTKLYGLSDKYYLAEDKDGDPFPGRMVDNALDDLFLVKKHLNKINF